MTKQRSTNQRSATAGRDMIGGDQTINNSSVHHHYGQSNSASVVEQLLSKLHAEMKDNVSVQPMIDDLRYYYEHEAHDGVIGLEQKLEKGGRAHEISNALEKKELFVKLLEKWSMYATAQEIFVHLLARAEYEYSNFVLPQLDESSEIELNESIASRIIEPIVDDCGASVFRMNHGTAMGMVYWLAEQCFVRWHK